MIEGDIADAVKRLRHEDGKDILVNGSSALVRTLIRDHLLDELRLLVHPVAVGSESRLFGDESDLAELLLADSRAYATGVIGLVTSRQRLASRHDHHRRLRLVDAEKGDSAVDAHRDLASRAREFDGCVHVAMTADSVDPEWINSVGVARHEAMEQRRGRANAPQVAIQLHGS